MSCYRDALAFSERDEDGTLELESIIETLKGRIRRLEKGRLKLPPETPYTEAHNTWVVNQTGTLLVIPVGDLAQHVLLNLCYMLQNGLVLTDDINKRSIPGIDTFKNIVDVNNVWPITFIEQWSLAALAQEKTDRKAA